MANNDLPKAYEILPEGKFDRSVSMLSWAYNEEQNIEEFVERALALLDSSCTDYELILIDDGSQDGTLELAGSLARKHRQIKVIANDRNLGPGWNTRIAIRHATKEYLFWQTVDWSYDISRLRLFLELTKYYDVIQGVRAGDHHRGPVAKTESIPARGWRRLSTRSDTLAKGFISISNYTLIRLLFGLPVGDYQNVTLYPARLIQQVALEGTSSFVNPECLLKTYWKGCSIKEVPIGFLKRVRGTANGTRPKAILQSVSNIFYYWCKWRLVDRLDSESKGRVYSYDPDEWKAGA